jgi:hypothetical protein
MEWFTRAFKRKFSDKDLPKIERLLRDLAVRKEKETNVRTLSPVAKMPVKIHDLLQIGLRRSLELAEASVRELNREHVSSSFVLVRGIFETTCLLFDAVRRVITVTEDNDPAKLDELDKFLMDVLFGFKSTEWHFSEDFVARNVLTIIERVSKQVGIDLMWYYEGLSEHAHPNYLGMMATYREPAEEGNPVVRFADSPNESRDASIIIAIGGLFIALDMLRLGIEQHAEVKGRFAAMCERAIHEGGTWPADVG